MLIALQALKHSILSSLGPLRVKGSWVLSISPFLAGTEMNDLLVYKTCRQKNPTLNRQYHLTMNSSKFSWQLSVILTFDVMCIHPHIVTQLPPVKTLMPSSSVLLPFQNTNTVNTAPTASTYTFYTFTS